MVSASVSLECRPAESPAAPRVEFLDAAQPAERKKWMELWSAWPQRDIMAHPDYVRLFARPEHRVIAATLKTGSGGILYPVIVRPIAGEPWAPPDARGCDFTNAYGYGGPFAWQVTPEDADAFWRQFDAWAAAQGATTSFARLSLFPGQMIPFNGETVLNGPNIVRRVDLPDSALWNDYRRDARRHIDIARTAGAVVEFDSTGERLDDFLNVYTSTMDRRNATKGYYFPRSFFEAIIQQLSGLFTIAHVVVKGKVVSSEIILLAADHGYSFLGGTLAEAFAFSPNYLLKHQAFRWCRDHGRKAVILGGGYQPNDGILNFKRRFGRGTDVPFLVGRKTYDAAETQRLVERRRQWERDQGRDWAPAPDYYPEYRA